jgi:hypothetical protein
MDGLSRRNKHEEVGDVVLAAVPLNAQELPATLDT